jgi:hypothetical protein
MTGWGARGCAVLAVFAIGCVSVDYVGRSYPPTAAVDLYMSPADVTRPYQVMGQVSAQVDVIPFVSQGQQLQDKLLEAARQRGADGIILGSLNTRQVGVTSQTIGQATGKKKGDKKKTNYNYKEVTTSSAEEVTELRGTLIKYTGP